MSFDIVDHEKTGFVELVAGQDYREPSGSPVLECSVGKAPGSPWPALEALSVIGGWRLGRFTLDI